LVRGGCDAAVAPRRAAARSPRALPARAAAAGINFGLEWAFMSGWGKVPDHSAWPGIPAMRFEAPLNSCLLLDALLTTFAIGSLCCAAATDGTQKEVRDKKCDVLDDAAIAGGWWRWTPVPIVTLGTRSLAMGFYFCALAGVPTFLVLWAAVGSGRMNGYAYTYFKGFWGAAVAAAVYTLVYPAAIAKRNFPELEFEELMAATQAAAGAPPLIANPALV
jgi:hypothetical protein